jgi:hypothetical protein
MLVPMHALFFLQHILTQSLAYVETCWSLQWGATECLPLWSWVATGSVATGALLLLGITWQAINNSLKNRAARQEKADRQLGAFEGKMKKPTQTGDAQTWDGVERRRPQNRRRMAPEEAMEVPSGMGYAEMRDHLDRRMSQDRRKIEPEAPMEKRSWMAYAEIRDYLDRRMSQAPRKIPPEGQ